MAGSNKKKLKKNSDLWILRLTCCHLSHPCLFFLTDFWSQLSLPLNRIGLVYLQQIIIYFKPDQSKQLTGQRKFRFKFLSVFYYLDQPLNHWTNHPTVINNHQPSSTHWPNCTLFTKRNSLLCLQWKLFLWPLAPLVRRHLSNHLLWYIKTESHLFSIN